MNACLVTHDDDNDASYDIAAWTSGPGRQRREGPGEKRPLASKDFNLEATLPAGKGGLVLLAGDKKTQVQVTIVGK